MAQPPAEVDNEALSVLLDNYGETVQQQAAHAYRATEHRPRLQDLGRELRDMAGRPRGRDSDAARLQALLDRWPEEP